MAYAAIILALIVLVVLHELGHFLAARAVGIRATKFYVFFPPALLKRTVGDVEYGIGAIPAGGFVKLPGMFEPNPGDVAERIRFELDDAMPHVRDGDVRLRLDAARRSIAHADGADGLVEPLTELRDGLQAARADLDADAREPRRIVDSSLERVENLLDDVHPKAYWRAALWRRMTVIFAGPLANLLIAFVVLTGFYAAWLPTYEVTKPIVVAQVTEDSPASEAGIDTDSRITFWNGKVVGLSPAEFADRVEESRGKPIELHWITDDGDSVERTIEPRRDDDGNLRIGLAPSITPDGAAVVGRHGVGVGTAIRDAADEMRFITVENMRRLPRIFFDSEVREDVGSVVGIVQVAQDVDRAGQLVGYVAIISLILAVMNLLPLLPLDGGHLLFGILEALRRKPMPRAAFERYSMLGMAFVLLLFFIGLDNDIDRARG